MVRLLILADDFTGALDTGVQFSARGIDTCVLTRPDARLSIADFDCQVLVLVTQTRHVSPDSAYETVERLTRWACEQGVAHVYKKTDSALRGNVGAELAAVLRGSGARVLPFLPALPSHRRVTVGGVHYVDGVPVSESPFGRDPFTPVTESNIARLLGTQTDIPITNGRKDALPGTDGIWVLDAETDGDLIEAGRRLAERGLLRVSAGCAGFAACLPELLDLKPGPVAQMPEKSGGLLVLCGSVNPITRRQLDWAEQHGFARLRLRPEQKLSKGYFDTDEGRRWLAALKSMRDPWLIVDANDPGDDNNASLAYAARLGLSMDEVRARVCRAMGRILPEVQAGPVARTPLITGGDTLLQCMEALGVDRMSPVAELSPGVVLSRFCYGGDTRWLISKSGGFGGETLLTDLRELLD